MHITTVLGTEGEILTSCLICSDTRQFKAQLIHPLSNLVLCLRYSIMVIQIRITLFTKCTTYKGICCISKKFTFKAFFLKYWGQNRTLFHCIWYKTWSHVSSCRCRWTTLFITSDTISAPLMGFHLHLFICLLLLPQAKALTAHCPASTTNMSSSSPLTLSLHRNSLLASLPSCSPPPASPSAVCCCLPLANGAGWTLSC